MGGGSDAAEEHFHGFHAWNWSAASKDSLEDATRGLDDCGQMELNDQVSNRRQDHDSDENERE